MRKRILAIALLAALALCAAPGHAVRIHDKETFDTFAPDTAAGHVLGTATLPAGTAYYTTMGGDAAGSLPDDLANTPVVGMNLGKGRWARVDIHSTLYYVRMGDLLGYLALAPGA